MKRCSGCRRRRRLSSFHRNSARRDGYSNTCRDCKNEWRRKYRKENVERYAEQRRRHIVKHKYGITAEDYDEILERQGGVCAVCGGPPKGKRFLSIDHVHETGEIRGLLCDPCNRGIGLLGDDPDRLAAAAAYVGERIAA